MAFAALQPLALVMAVKVAHMKVKGMTSGRCFCLLYSRVWVCACVCQAGLMRFPFSLWDACPEVRRRLQWRAAGLKGFYFSLSSVAPAKLHQRKMLHCRIYLHLHSRVWQQLKGVLLCIFNALNHPVWWWQAFVKLCSDLSRLANQPPRHSFRSGVSGGRLR